MTTTLEREETKIATTGTDIEAETLPLLEPADIPDETRVPKLLMLNIGCGPDWAEHLDWTGIDRENHGQDWVLDLPRDVLPFSDESVDAAVANHFLQMIPYVDLPQVLDQIYRVLRHGATFRILVPDVLRAVDAYWRDDKGWFPIVNSAEGTIGGKFCAYATWYGEARTVFTPAWLCELLARAGFNAVAVTTHSLTMLGDERICELDSRPNESLVVEGSR